MIYTIQKGDTLYKIAEKYNTSIEDIINSNPKWANSPDDYVTNGPFKLTEWLRDSYMTLVPNENYYDRTNVKPTKVELRLIAKDSTVLSAFKSGELDVGSMIPTDERESMKGKGLVTESSLGNYYLSINLNINDGEKRSQKNQVLLESKVRRALALAIDRNYIVKNVTKSGEIPADTFIPPALQKDSSGNDIYNSLEKWWDNNNYKGNCEEARRLLQEAGVDGKDITVEYLYNSEGSHVSIAEAVQNMWQKELGITATCRNEEWAVFQTSRQTGKFQIARNGWIADYHDAMTFSDLLVSTGPQNDSSYSNPTYDDVIARAKVATGPEYDALIIQGEKILKEETPIIPLYFYTSSHLRSDRIDGLYTYMNHLYFKNAVKNN
jgi:oligopeptide transport system substrate-binding protein